MLTICWAAKGGSGTTVTATSLALAQRQPALLVDLAGDVPLVLGVDGDEACGVYDWLGADARPAQLGRLEHAVTDRLSYVPSGVAASFDVPPSAPAERWRMLAEHLARDPRPVVVDAGTGRPPHQLVERADANLLVTRPCYVALRRAMRLAVRPTGIVLLDEPGRALRPADVSAALDAPVVAILLLDPKIARAVDAGLAVARLPRACVDQLRHAS